MDVIIAWAFVVFGVVMSILCFIQGARKIMEGETAFRGIRLLKHINEHQGSLKDFTGTEIVVIGVFLMLATLVFYYLVFL